MRTLFHITAALKASWVGALFFFLFCSFCFHMVHGQRGYAAYSALTQDRAELVQEYETLKAEREGIEHKVKGLRKTSLDLDLLDQQVRVMLRRGGENEFLLEN